MTNLGIVYDASKFNDILNEAKNEERYIENGKGELLECKSFAGLIFSRKNQNPFSSEHDIKGALSVAKIFFNFKLSNNQYFFDSAVRSLAIDNFVGDDYLIPNIRGNTLEIDSNIGNRQSADFGKMDFQFHKPGGALNSKKGFVFFSKDALETIVMQSTAYRVKEVIISGADINYGTGKRAILSRQTYPTLKIENNRNMRSNYVPSLVTGWPCPPDWGSPFSIASSLAQFRGLTINNVNLTNAWVKFVGLEINK